MGLFDKVKTQASTLSSGLGSVATKINSDALSSANSNEKLVAIQADIVSIDGQLEVAYREIGKKYVESLVDNGGNFELGIKDTLSHVEPYLEKKIKLENKAIKIEKALKDQLLMQEKGIFQRNFDEAKAKLDKALKMDIISQDEYDEKIAKERTKLDNFDQIRKIKKQYDMKLISKDEMNSKLSKLGL